MNLPPTAFLTAVLCGILSAAAAPPPPSTASPLPPAALVSTDNPSGGAILRHGIVAVVDTAGSRLTAADTLSVLHAPGTPATTAFPFLLWKDLAVASAEGEGAEVRVDSRPRLNPRDFWRRPPYAQLGGYENARQHDLILESGGTWPETLRVVVRYAGALYDSLQPPKAAYARSFETTEGLIDGRGVYLCGASFWIPQRADEVFTFRLAAGIPAGWRAVSQGRLAEAMEAGDARAGDAMSAAGAEAARWDVWDCPHPMEEAYLVAGPWTLHRRDHAGTDVETFTYAATDSTIYSRYLDGTARYLDLYGGLIGPYPFAKFALVENFWQTGFGMPSFTLLGDRVIRLPFILDTSYGHEILHNWWGNGVFVDASQGNWCEGLTTYGADYLYKERESAEAARQYRLNALAAYADYVSAGEEIPLSEFKARHDFATQAIGYSKSMMVIHGIRRRVGEESFWRGLRTFYERNLWRRASWADLLDSFGAPIDAQSYLRQWIERTGAPRLTLSEASAEPRDGHWTVTALVGQATAGSPYDLLVPVRVTFADGDSTWRFPLGGEEAGFSVEVDREPLRFALDPDFEMMRRIDPAEVPPTLSRTLGADTVTVVLASGLSPEMEKAYRNLAEEWARGQALAIVKESDRPPGWSPSTSAWLFGTGPLARRLLGGIPEVEMRPEEPGHPAAGPPGGGWRISGHEYPGTSNVVVTGMIDDSERSWSLLQVTSPEEVAVIGAKVPHYGKYSWLVFDGGRNVGDGVWTETNSPLVVQFAAGANRASGRVVEEGGH